MPLFKVETRTKAADVSPDPSPSSSPDTAAPRSAGRSRPAGDGGASVVALLLGALSALVVLAGASVFLVRRFGPEPAPAAQPAAPSSAIGTGGVGPAAGAPTGFGPRPAPALDHVAPLNVDYPRTTAIAIVNGEAYTMAHLEAAVRVARSLGTLSADPVPSFQDASALRRFQVDMLKRQIDVILIRQSALAQGSVPPDASAEPAIQGFLQVVGATQEQLDDALASNGASRAHLEAWFTDAALVDFFIQTTLMPGQDPARRAEVAQAWIDAAWASSDIQINFYPPEE